MSKRKASYPVGENVVRPLQKAVWRFLKKLKRELPDEPAIPLLGTNRSPWYESLEKPIIAHKTGLQ